MPKNKKRVATQSSSATDPLLACKADPGFRQSMTGYMQQLRERSLWKQFREREVFRAEEQDLVVLEHVIGRINQWLSNYKGSFDAYNSLLQMWQLREELSDVTMHFPLLQMFTNEMMLALDPDAPGADEHDINQLHMIRQDVIDTFGAEWGPMDIRLEPWSSTIDWTDEQRKPVKDIFAKYSLTRSYASKGSIAQALYALGAAREFKASDQCCLPLVAYCWVWEAGERDDYNTVRRTIGRFILQLVELRALLISQHSQLNLMTQKIMAGIATGGVAVGQLVATYAVHAISAGEAGSN